jgi:hypothetical protein
MKKESKKLRLDIRPDQELMDRIDAWRAQQRPLPNRAEAVKQILDKVLPKEDPFRS